MQEIAGEELVHVQQIKSKIPRRKALSALEEKVLDILTEKGYVSPEETLEATETIAEMLEEEDEDEEVIVDGEVDEGDVHIKPTARKATRLVLLTRSIILFLLHSHLVFLGFSVILTSHLIFIYL